MGEYEDGYRKIVKELYNALENNDNDKIEKLKYKALSYGYSLIDVIVNYISLNKFGIKFNFGCKTIKKGTKFYRIREFKENIDFLNKKEWTPPPHRPQNRANKQGEEALYLGSSESICILEAQLHKDQKYVLAIYECIEDIKLGGFFAYNEENNLHNLAGITLNAFLIAPARCEKNTELFQYLDKEYMDVSLENLVDWKNSIELPYKFAVLNKKDKYYEVTNRLCDVLKEQYPDGIEYSSCYIPIETLGIECSDFNVVLYSEGIKKVNFITAEIKKYENFVDKIELAKISKDVANIETN